MTAKLSRNDIGLLVAAAALRLVVFIALPKVPAILGERVEISTPISSYKRLKEGLFLFERGVSPYDGGVYHQAPLLLSLFEILPASFVFTVLDILNAYNIGLIAQNLKLPSPRFKPLSSTTAMLAYLFNPFTLLTCLGRSTNLFANAAILQAVVSAITGNSFGAMFAIATGTYLSLHPALLLPPVILLCTQSIPTLKSDTGMLTLVGTFAGVLALLVGSSVSLTGSFSDFLSSCYGAQISVTDLTPNIGLWWYFFIEIFDAFREFFIGVFWLHLIGYVGALTVRLPNQPVFVIICLVGLIAIFKPYPSVSDVSLYLGMSPLYRHVMPLTRYTFLAVSTMLYATLLGPAFYYIWIYAGSGNANFFYAITLVWSLGLSMLVGDGLYAVLRDEWEMERPEMRGKEARQI